MSNYYIGNVVCTNELSHHGIIGQRWGFRRFQNPDGSLTPEGRIRYGSGTEQKKLADKLMKGKWSSVSRSPQYKHILAKLDTRAKRNYEAAEKYRKMEQDFYSNDKERRKWVEKTIDRIFKKDRNYFGEGVTREQAIEGYMNSDWDQGEDYSSSWYTYKHSNDKGGKKALRAEIEWDNTMSDLDKAAREYVKEFLSEYGDVVVGTNSWRRTTTVGDIFTRRILERAYRYGQM